MEKKGQGERRTAGVTKKRAKDQEESEGRGEQASRRERDRKKKKPVSVITEHD